MHAFLRNLPVRPGKPRETGLTLVIDTGLSVNEATNLVSKAQAHIDFIKLGFGTALFTGQLEQKLEVYRQSGIPVFFGGTLFEAFIVRGQFDDYLRLLGEYRIEYAEVSDGSLPMHPETKCGYIQTLARYVTVLSEVGSKSDAFSLTASEWGRAMRLELEAGARYVIAEARESGTAGVYTAAGEVKGGLIPDILRDVPGERVIWEAPTKAQQAWFINALGNEANLGNVQPEDVIPLEALRFGLRGDTFLKFCPAAGLAGTADSAGTA